MIRKIGLDAGTELYYTMCFCFKASLRDHYN